MWLSTSVDCWTKGRPCVCIFWWGGLLSTVSAVWYSCVAAHWSKYHCYKQTPWSYDFRCLKVTINPNKQTINLHRGLPNGIWIICEKPLFEFSKFWELFLMINRLECFFGIKDHAALDKNPRLGYNMLLFQLIPGDVCVPVDSVIPPFQSSCTVKLLP